jgi:hypothetical protein
MRERVGFIEDDLDLDRQPWASQVRATLQVQNRSAEALTIAEVVSTCGCMVIDGVSALERKVLPAGSSLPIDVVLNTGRRPGVRSAYLQLRTTDVRTYTARVRALVVGDWQLSADIIDFGDVPVHADKGPTETVVFSSSQDQLLGPPTSRAPWLKCTTARRSADATNTVDIVLRVEPDSLPPGLSTTGVKVATTNRTVPNAWITVRARGTTPLTPYPPHVLLKPGGAGTVRFVDRDGQLARIASVDAPALGTRVLSAGTLELSIADATGLDGPARVEVRDELGQIGTVLVSTAGFQLNGGG